MKTFSDNEPEEMEFLQGGLLVRWNIEQYNKKEDDSIGYEYDEIKVELNDTKEQIIFKLVDYADDKGIFADKILLKIGN